MNELQLYCEQIEPGLVRVADITDKDADFYPDASIIKGWQFSLFRNDILVGQDRTDDARNGDWLIRSRDCTGIGKVFPSDVYEVRVELFGLAERPRRLANYFVRCDIQPGQHVYLKKNGAYFDFTPDGKLVDGQWEWKILGTYDDFSTYQVRGNGISKIETEEIIPDIIQETTYENVQDTIVLLGGSISKVFCAVDKVLLAEAVKRRINRLLGPKRYGDLIPYNDVDQKMMDAFLWLDMLEDGLITDAASARKVLQLAQAYAKLCLK